MTKIILIVNLLILFFCGIAIWENQISLSRQMIKVGLSYPFIFVVILIICFQIYLIVFKNYVMTLSKGSGTHKLNDNVNHLTKVFGIRKLRSILVLIIGSSVKTKDEFDIFVSIYEEVIKNSKFTEKEIKQEFDFMKHGPIKRAMKRIESSNN